MVSYYDSKPLL